MSDLSLKTSADTQQRMDTDLLQAQEKREDEDNIFYSLSVQAIADGSFPPFASSWVA